MCTLKRNKVQVISQYHIHEQVISYSICITDRETSDFTPAEIRSRTGRGRRSAKTDRYGQNNDQTVETLVVVDKTMYWDHGKPNITMYILSIFNIVSRTLNIIIIVVVFVVIIIILLLSLSSSSSSSLL